MDVQLLTPDFPELCLIPALWPGVALHHLLPDSVKGYRHIQQQAVIIKLFSYH